MCHYVLSMYKSQYMFCNFACVNNSHTIPLSHTCQYVKHVTVTVKYVTNGHISFLFPDSLITVTRLLWQSHYVGLILHCCVSGLAYISPICRPSILGTIASRTIPSPGIMYSHLRLLSSCYRTDSVLWLSQRTIISSAFLVSGHVQSVQYPYTLSVARSQASFSWVHGWGLNWSPGCDPDKAAGGIGKD